MPFLRYKKAIELAQAHCVSYIKLSYMILRNSVDIYEEFVSECNERILQPRKSASIHFQIFRLHNELGIPVVSHDKKLS